MFSKSCVLLGVALMLAGCGWMPSFEPKAAAYQAQKAADSTMWTQTCENEARHTACALGTHLTDGKNQMSLVVALASPAGMTMGLNVPRQGRIGPSVIIDADGTMLRVLPLNMCKNNVCANFWQLESWQVERIYTSQKLLFFYHTPQGVAIFSVGVPLLTEQLNKLSTTTYAQATK